MTSTSTPSLAQLAAEAVAASGGSIAAWARHHQVPYLSVTRLINEGIPPRRGEVLQALARALGLGEAGFQASLDRSRSAPTPAAMPKHSDHPTNPLQAALLAVVQERNLTTKAFAEEVELSPLTASRLLKDGDLPGRQTTHEKLRQFLKLEIGEYQALVGRSRGLAASPVQPVVHVPDEPEEHPPSAVVHQGGDELVRLASRLNPRQYAALVGLIKTLV